MRIRQIQVWVHNFLNRFKKRELHLIGPKLTSDNEVTAILEMNAEEKGCKVSDLQWKCDKYGHIHTRVRKR